MIRITIFCVMYSLKEIIGNMDRSSVEGRILDQPIIARYVRIHPTAWSRHICMRVELFGCREGRFDALYWTFSLMSIKSKVPVLFCFSRLTQNTPCLKF